MVGGRFSDVLRAIDPFQERKFAQVYDKGPIKTASRAQDSDFRAFVRPKIDDHGSKKDALCCCAPLQSFYVREWPRARVC